MAITSDAWPLFAHVLKFIRTHVKPSGPRIKTLSLGTTDFFLSRADIANAFGAAAAAAAHVRPDSAAIAKWHHNQASEAFDAKSLYSAIGFDVDFVDIAVVRGGEIVQDLNMPLASNLGNRYELVIDSGTIEHCFNVGQAMANIVQALKPGGMVYHGNPLLMMNHGFFNFCPAFYWDFYTNNGFKVHDLFIIEGPQIERPPLIGRFKLSTPTERTINVVAQKISDVPIKWPTQSKYTNNPGQIEG